MDEKLVVDIIEPEHARRPKKNKIGHYKKICLGSGILGAFLLYAGKGNGLLSVTGGLLVGLSVVFYGGLMSAEKDWRMFIIFVLLSLAAFILA